MQKVPFDCFLDVTKAYEEKGKWIVEGLAATTDFDLQDDIVSQDAIKASADDLLENSTVLLNHNPNDSMGKVLTSKASDGALLLKILVSKTVPEIWQKIKEGVLNKFSIRGKILEARKKWLPTLKTFAREILKMRLVEVSLVAVPANPKAKALRWYIEKALSDFEDGGGKIEMDAQTDSEGVKPMPEEQELEVNEAEGEPAVEKGFPSPAQLTEEWTEFAKQKGLKDGDESWDAWIEFCKQNAYPQPYPYPYPRRNAYPKNAAGVAPGTRMREVIALADKLLADEKDEARKKLLEQIKVIAQGATFASPAPKAETAKNLAAMKPDDIIKAARTHAALLLEQVSVIQKLINEIGDGAASMDAKDLKAKLSQLQSIIWKVEEAANAVNVSGGEGTEKTDANATDPDEDVEKSGRKVSAARLTKLKTLLDELSKFVTEVDLPADAEKSEVDADPAPAPEAEIVKKLGTVVDAVTLLSKSLGFGAEETEGEKAKSIVETVGDIAKRLEVLENSPGERGSLDGQEDLEKSGSEDKSVFKGLIQ